jgi:2-phosphosulfolactate phosphatase
MGKSLQVIATPTLVNLYDLKDKNIVVIDVLRATTTICTALFNGAKSIKPVLTTDMALEYAGNNYILAAERGGKKVQGFQFGNSPREFTEEVVKDKNIVLTTTNGTKCIHLSTGGKRILAGSFVNLNALATFLISQPEDVILFCAGWKDKFNLEDFLFAGALASLLKPHFEINCDATEASIDLYHPQKGNLNEYILKASHAKRFKNLGITEDIAICFSIDSYPVIPILENGSLVPLSANCKS